MSPVFTAVIDEPPLFASAVHADARRRGGIGPWLGAAVALVVGIVIGFAAGYRAAPPDGGGADRPPVEQAGPAGTPSPAQTFSESTVNEPVRVDPDPIVTGAPVASEPIAERPQAPPPAAPEPPPAAQGPPSRSPAREPAARPPVPSAAAGVPAGTGAPTATTGSMQVLSRPSGARVVIDGKPVGTTPVVIAEVTPGRHSVLLELPGFNRWTTTVDVTAGGATRVAASLEQ